MQQHKGFFLPSAVHHNIAEEDKTVKLTVYVTTATHDKHVLGLASDIKETAQTKKLKEN